MQDGASPHRTETTVEWLDDHDVNLIDYPAYSLDINIMENVWGDMACLHWRTDLPGIQAKPCSSILCRRCGKTLAKIASS